MKFQDYYATLGVARSASGEEIQRSYRKLARKCHPDVNKAAGSEDKFKQLSEAYEVLKDPEKRKLYDQLGENWKAGQDFRPPPGWEQQQRPRSTNGAHAHAGAEFDGQTFSFGGNFSDFFQAFFGGAGGGINLEELAAQMGGDGGGRPYADPFGYGSAPQAAEADLPVSVADLLSNTPKQISFDVHSSNGSVERKTLNVKIPPGTADGSVIRLAGQGGVGPAGPVDLLLKVRVTPDLRFRVAGDGLVVKLPVSPWEAALGDKVDLNLPDGAIKLNVPAGTQSGQKLRVKSRGLPQKGGVRGDLLVEIEVVVPRELSPRERELFEQLKSSSTFQPRR